MLGSWVGVIGVLGSGLVIFWTALENWLDSRATVGASAALGLLLVLAGSAVLTAAAVVRAVEPPAARSDIGPPDASCDRLGSPLRLEEPAVQLDAAEDAERNRCDRPITAKTSVPEAESGKARKVVSPINPSEPMTSSQNPGRNIA